MRAFELLIPLLAAVWLAWPSPRPSAVRLLPIVTVIAVFLHLVIEGWRWQMVPIYAIVALLAALAALGARRSRDPGRSGDLGRVASWSLLVVLAVSAALPVLLPVPVISAPGGPYRIGTRVYELSDPSRKEIYSGRDEARRFMIQVWYPASPLPSDRRAPWMANAKLVAPAIATFMDLPSFFLDHLVLVKIPAFQDSPLTQGEEKFPIILFSHGWNGFNAQNTGQALQLASHGYVVVGVQHTYGAALTVFPDGTVVRNNPAALPDGAPTAEYEIAARRLVAQWSGDLGFSLDFLLAQNKDRASPFLGRLDESRVGVYGHSTGGGAAIQFAGSDARVKAVLGQDPFMRPVSTAVLGGGVPQPAFFMFSQRWTDDAKSRNNELFAQFIPHSPKAIGVVSIAGTAHFDFSDLPLLSPLAPQLGLKGPIDGKLVTAIVDDYLLGFFDLTLRNKPSGLFTGASPYAEVKPRN
ncbi:MAG: hypothetical protein WCL50_14955 [Spirochaetota bacterium]